MDECSLVDPRTKQLTYLTELQRKRTEARVLASLEVMEEKSEMGEESDQVTEAEVVCEPSQQEQPGKVGGLLSSLLQDFQSKAPVKRRVSSKSAQEELRRYMSEPPCALEDDPLSW